MSNLFITTTKSPLIRPCACKNESQDKLYGKQRRVWNNAPSNGATPSRYRCTVCLNEKTF